jgi:hypothetical protein
VLWTCTRIQDLSGLEAAGVLRRSFASGGMNPDILVKVHNRL